MGFRPLRGSHPEIKKTSNRIACDKKFTGPIMDGDPGTVCGQTFVMEVYQLKAGVSFRG